MKYIGAHVSSEPTLATAPRQAAMLGATAFALNLVDPSKWRSPELSDTEADEFKAECALYGFTAAQILPHAGFVINPASPDARKLKLSELALADEMRRAARLGLSMVNFHPGASLKKITEDEAIALISQTINKVLASTDGVKAVIENTAGQGSNLGYTFEQIGRMIEGIEDRSRVGVCIDTAHAHAAGYDLSHSDGYDAMWADFEKHIGLKYLSGMHINDSAREASSRIDRHAPIGAGTIGEEVFRRLVADPRTDGIPLILETPDPALWQAEVAALKSWSGI
ncbi:MAG: deoxyribonuclease IV [Muribaculaceae bacterium]|nr:deoxyribonuclease IV [Muribaculaceae bacterium]